VGKNDMAEFNLIGDYRAVSHTVAQ
jgi:hypothetical protein